MISWLRQNQKKAMAVAGALLMVTFLISGPMNRMPGDAPPRVVKAHVGKAVVYADELGKSEEEWRMLERVLGKRGLLGAVGLTIASQMDEHPNLFLLLTKEAEQRGIGVSNDLLQTVLRNNGSDELSAMAEDPKWQSAVRHLLMVQMLRNQLLSNVKLSEPEWKHQQAEQDRLLRLSVVEFNAEKLVRATTQPTTQQSQTLFDSYKNVLPDSADKPAGDVLGFAYEVPNRVKLQYLTIPRTEVLKAVEDKHRDAKDLPGKAPYDLVEKAREYYDTHETEFVSPAPATLPATEPTTAPANSPATQPITQPTTQPATLPANFAAVIPATQPTTQPSTLPAVISNALLPTSAPTTQPTTAVASAPPTTQPATSVATTQPSPTTATTQVATTGPTTRPFADVQDEIITKILKDEADELEKQIADAVVAKMTSDWQTWKATQPTTGPAAATLPATQPTTQPAGYASYAYLQGVAESIQSQFKVSLEVTQVPEWSDATALQALTGIGPSKSGEQAFDKAALNAAAFSADASAKSAALQVLQPSATFAAHDNDYIFRLTDVSPAHAPDLASILPRVEDDARLQAAYDLANARAAKLFESAKRKGFDVAALDDALNVTHTGDFSSQSISIRQGKPDPDAIPNFKLATDKAREVLYAKVLDLLSQASDQNPRPFAVIPLPSEKIVIVAQLLVSERRMPPGVDYYQRLSFSQRSMQQVEMLTEPYFTYDTVVKRVDYKPEGDKSSGS